MENEDEEHEASSVATSLHSELSTTGSSSQESTDLDNYDDPDVMRILVMMK